MAGPALQEVPALAKMTRASTEFWSTGTGTKTVDEGSSHDHEEPTMAAHSVCTCCHKVRSE